MEYRILGLLEVRYEGRPVMIGGPQQRALLAALLLNADRVVSVDRLVELLWAQDPPARPGHCCVGASRGYVERYAPVPAMDRC